MECFKLICEIPRGSGNEKGIADFLERFATERGYFCVRDSLNNVYVRREAHPSKAQQKSVMLQSHTDMVCEKLCSSSHDFLTDPIELIFEDGYVRANGTTLGADDGAGVAVMMSLLDKKELIAPETEYLFTSSEETGMDGAFGFDYSLMRSFRMINLDSEDEANACISCAGGLGASIELPIDRVRAQGRAYRLSVSGLLGGHSGVEIDSGKKNALKIAAFLLDRIYKLYPFHIASAKGGTKTNVITPECEFVIIFYNEDDAKQAQAELKALTAQIRDTLILRESKGFKTSLTKVGESEKEEIVKEGMLTLKSSSLMISALTVIPQGVIERIAESSAPAASVNCGALSLLKDTLTLRFLIRSQNDLFIRQIFATLERVAHVLGGKAIDGGGYPGWEYRRGSELQDAYERSSKEVFGRAPVFSSIHAGLECGIFASEIEKRGEKADIISIGPDMDFIHSPKERMNVASLERLYELCLKMLQTL